MALNIQQTPEESLDWAIDYTTRGIPVGGVITASTWSVEPSDPMLSNENIINNGTMTTFTLTGGIENNLYLITNTVTFSTGQIMQETIGYECIPARNL